MKAIYALSGDPPHNGHLWVIENAAKLCDELLVAVGDNSEKSPMFSLTDRLEMLAAITKHLPNVKVLSYPKVFLVDFAKKCGVRVLVRGIRSAGDFQSERALQQFNQRAWPEFIHVYLSPPWEMAYIQSTLVKGMIGYEDWERHLADLVPPVVFERLKHASRLR